jgi:hypothetical protein
MISPHNLDTNNENMAPKRSNDDIINEYRTALHYGPIETYSEILAIGPSKALQIPETIKEHPREYIKDEEVHRFYKVPMQALKSSRGFLMHCSVHRDTLPKITYVGTNTWVSTDYFIWEMSAGLANSGRNPGWTQFFESTHLATWKQIQKQFERIGDRSERFKKKVPIPPFQVAEVRVETDCGDQYFRLDACSSRDVIDSSFWALWRFIFRRGVRFIDSVVTLRAPTITPPGESLVDPAALLPLSESSTVRTVRSALSALRISDAVHPAPLRVRRRQRAQPDDELQARGYSGHTAAIRTPAGSVGRARFPIE